MSAYREKVTGKGRDGGWMEWTDCKAQAQMRTHPNTQKAQVSPIALELCTEQL